MGYFYAHGEISNTVRITVRGKEMFSPVVFDWVSYKMQHEISKPLLKKEPIAHRKSKSGTFNIHFELSQTNLGFN